MINRDEKGRFMPREVKDYGYYSKLLNKPFNSVEELKAAEKEYYEAQNKKQTEVAEKKALAHKVEDSYEKYMTTLEEGNKQITEFVEKIKKAQNEAYNSYLKDRNEFIDKFGSFHMTFVDKKPQVDTENNINIKKIYEDSLNNLFDVVKSFPFIF